MEAVLVVKIPECIEDRLLIREEYMIDSVESITKYFPRCSILKEGIEFLDFSELAADEVFSFKPKFLITMPIISRVLFTNRLFTLMLTGYPKLLEIFVKMMKNIAKESFTIYEETILRYKDQYNLRAYSTNNDARVALITTEAVIKKNNIVIRNSKKEFLLFKRAFSSESSALAAKKPSKVVPITRSNTLPDFFSSSSTNNALLGSMKYKPLSTNDLNSLSNSVVSSASSSTTSSKLFFSNPISRRGSRVSCASIGTGDSVHDKIFRKKNLGPDEDDPLYRMRKCLFISKYTVTSLNVEDCSHAMTGFAYEHFKSRIFS